MLAIKLHRKTHPNLGKGTYWIPIIDWDSAQAHVKNWYWILTQPGSDRKGIYYITLASIPNNHPVFLKVDFGVGFGTKPRDYPFQPLNEIERNIFDALKPLQKPPEKGIHHVAQGFLKITDGTESLGQSLCNFPELILGARLPKSCVKWTKDIRLLFRGDTRKKKPSP